MESKVNELKSLLAEAHDLQNAAALLDWDQQTYMPPGGAEARSYQLATLESLAHRKFTAPEVGKLLEDLQTRSSGLDPELNDACLIRVTARQYAKQTRVPPEMVAEFSRVTAMAQQAWRAGAPRKSISPDSNRTWKKLLNCANNMPACSRRTIMFMIPSWTILSLD